MRPGDVRELRAVLPWLVHALEERPNLTAKQRTRRLRTRAALVRLLTQIGETPDAATTDGTSEGGA
jgi:hypothetical protein